MTQPAQSAIGIEGRRNRLYERYAGTHSGRKHAGFEAVSFRSHILPHLPSGDPVTQAVVDIGCGQGDLVRQLQVHGYAKGRGVDISPEQVEIAHSLGNCDVECGDYRAVLGSYSGRLSAAIATDFLEHLTKDEVLVLFDTVRAALRPGGVFIVRSPNGISPFFGNYQYSDFTHETVFTPRSFSQVAINAGFGRVESFPVNPIRHDLKSAARCAVWSAASAVLRVVLAAETGRRDHLVTQNFVGVATV